MEKWEKIPVDDKKLHVLITHGPPLKHGDRVISGKNVGCADLSTVISKVKPIVHLFGHIHEGYGVTKDESTLYINGSNCSFRYKPVNEPIVFDLRRKYKELIE